MVASYGTFEYLTSATGGTLKTQTREWQEASNAYAKSRHMSKSARLLLSPLADETQIPSPAYRAMRAMTEASWSRRIRGELRCK